MRIALLVVATVISPLPATAQGRAADPVAPSTVASTTPRLYCGRLAIGGRWIPETSACKTIKEWRAIIDRAEERESETRQIINIGPNQR